MERKNRAKALLIAVTAVFVLWAAAFAANAQIVSISQPWDDVGTNTTTWIQTSQGMEAQVTIDPDGAQDGYVTIYVCPSQVVGTCTAVGTVAAADSATTTYVGTSSAFLYLTLTGNTPATGAIDAFVIVKK